MNKIKLLMICHFSDDKIRSHLLLKKNHKIADYAVWITNLFFDYAFNMLNLRKIYGYLIECNEVSKKMLENLGFIYEGVLRKHIFYDGKYNDVYIVSIFCDSFK